MIKSSVNILLKCFLLFIWVSVVLRMAIQALKVNRFHISRFLALSRDIVGFFLCKACFCGDLSEFWKMQFQDTFFWNQLSFSNLLPVQVLLYLILRLFKSLKDFRFAENYREMIEKCFIWITISIWY